MSGVEAPWRSLLIKRRVSGVRGVCVEAISMEDDKAVIDQDLCTECEACIVECPVEAIKLE